MTKKRTSPEKKDRDEAATTRRFLESTGDLRFTPQEKLEGLTKEQLHGIVREMNKYDAPKTASKAQLVQTALLKHTAYSDSAMKSVDGAGNRVSNEASTSEGMKRLDAELNQAIRNARTAQGARNEAAIDMREKKSVPKTEPKARSGGC